MRSSVRRDATRSLPATGAAGVPALRLHRVSKRFGAEAVVDGLTVDVPRGCVFGLLGEAGETVAAMVAGVLPPDEGRIEVHGTDVWDSPVLTRDLLGEFSTEISVPEHLTGRDWLVYTALRRGLDSAAAARRADEVSGECGLAGAELFRIGDYLPGLRHRLYLAAALLHRPQVLVLDKPFEGIDVPSARAIRVVLRRFVNEGGTVVLTGARTAAAEALCDKVAEISGGRVREVTPAPLDGVGEPVPAARVADCFAGARG
jgi:ABC-2 type transport system ATP-binding protein